MMIYREELYFRSSFFYMDKFPFVFLRDCRTLSLTSRLSSYNMRITSVLLGERGVKGWQTY